MIKRLGGIEFDELSIEFDEVGVEFGELSIVFGELGVEFDELSLEFDEVGVGFGEVGVVFFGFDVWDWLGKVDYFVTIKDCKTAMTRGGVIAKKKASQTGLCRRSQPNSLR